ncbi:MAG: T9SS type A sorting domain-containing protein [bacterium]|nr:T9SS type A sorting domain-containing protein [bacterium]
MKRLAFVILLLIPQLALSQTSVSGNQSGLWTSAGSPYLVMGELVIPPGQVLTIEPGVEVNFQGHFKFYVYGNLQALGSDGENILFTTDNQSIGWGGIRISSSAISNLSFCRIEYGKTVGDYPDIHGGALALFGSDAVVSNCVFADNDATGNNGGMGGAVYANGTGSASGPLTRFIDCRFIGNHCYGEGGAIKFTGDMNSEISGCEFIANDCGYGGGAISCYGVEGTRIVNCLFADNYTMYGNGGALNTLGFSNTLYMVNCTLSGNSAVTGEGGAINLAYASAYFVNNIIYSNSGMYSDDLNLDWGGNAEVYYSNLVMPAGATGSDNINVDPEFVDAVNLDFHLQEGSDCINAGTAYFALGENVLVDLSPDQYVGSAPDMGAFEYTPVTGVSTGSLTTCSMYQNYPNPFALTTSISYNLESDSFVRIKVYDVQGKEIRTIVNGHRAAGGRSVVWDGLNNSGQRVGTGTYFARMQAGSDVSSIRMLLTR